MSRAQGRALAHAASAGRLRRAAGRDAAPRLRAGGTFAQQADSLAAPLDILVGTPGKVAQHAGRGNLYYGDVQLVRARAPAPARRAPAGGVGWVTLYTFGSSAQVRRTWWHHSCVGAALLSCAARNPSAAPYSRAQESAAWLPGVRASPRSLGSPGPLHRTDPAASLSLCPRQDPSAPRLCVCRARGAGVREPPPLGGSA